MLHNQNLPTNPGKFEGIERKFNRVTTNKGMADVIARYRKEMIALLKSQEAEDIDENKLKTLIDEMGRKNQALESNLGQTNPGKIDLSNDTYISDFWESIVSGNNNKLLGHPGDGGGSPIAADVTALQTKIGELLGKLQYLKVDSDGITQEKTGSNKKLMTGSFIDITDVNATIRSGTIAQLLDETDETKVKSDIANILGESNGNIASSRLSKISQKKVATRILLYLYCAYKISQDATKFSKALYREINSVLKVLEKDEINKIKGLYNINVELKYLKPEYETLKELNSMKGTGEIDLGSHNLGAAALNISAPLTGEFESGSRLTQNIDEYKLLQDETVITDAGGTTYKAFFVDSTGNADDLSVTLARHEAVDFCIEVMGQRVKIGKITLSNDVTPAELKIDIDDEATINAELARVGAGGTLTLPLDFDIPVKGIKTVKSGILTVGKASLTKIVKLKIAGGGGGGGGGGGLGGTIDVEASISNVTEISREEAERAAEEKLRERYENLAWYSPDRINLFFRRDYIKEKYVRKIMKGEQGLSRKERDMDATERQQLQNSQGTIFDVDITTSDLETEFPVVYAQVDALCKNYLGTPPAYISTMTDDIFKEKFEEIVNSEDNPELIKKIGKERLLTYSSNILFRMKMFKAHQKLVNDIVAYITAGHTEPEIDTYCRTEIKKYMDVYNDLPSFLETAGISLEDPNFGHNVQVAAGTLAAISAQTMKLKMQIITKGSAAYKIKQKRGGIAKIGDVIDSGFLKDKKKNMPVRLLQTLGWTRGIARTGAVVGAGIAGGLLLGPLGTSLVVGTTVGLRTLFSKYSHYTKEYEGQLKNEAVDLANYEKERTRLRKAMTGKRGLERLGLRGKDKKDVRHRNRYVNTTHGKSAHTTILADNIRALANKDTILTAGETKALKDFVSEGFARLIYYKRKGQNFLGSDDVNKAEGDYKNLYAKLISGARRLGWTRADGTLDKHTIQHYPNYQTTMDIIRDGYKKADRKFKKKRAALGRGNAIVTGAVAGGASYLSSKLGGKTVGRKDEHNFFHSGDENSVLPMSNVEKSGGSRSLFQKFHDEMIGTTNSSGYELYVSPEVDAIPTGPATSHTFASLDAKINAIKSTIPATDTKTLDIYNKAMTIHPGRENIPRYKRTAMERALAYAKSHGADTGNQYLFGERFAETVKDTLAARTSAGTGNVPIKRIWFRRPSANAAASVTGSSGTLTERSMNGVLRIQGGPGVPVQLSRNTFKRHEGKVKPTSSAHP